MNQEAMQRRVKVYRVLTRYGRSYSECTVIEDVERAQFQTGNGFFGCAAMISKDPAMNLGDVRDVLNTLRRYARSPGGSILPVAADSVDTAVSQAEIRMQEVEDWAFRGKVPTWAREEQSRTDRASPPVMMRPVRPGEGPSQEEIERMAQETWDFAAGAKLRWKRLGRTPAGRRYDVLTFSGSDEVLLSPTGIELPASQK